MTTSTARDELGVILRGQGAAASSAQLALAVPELSVRVEGVGPLALPVTAAWAKRLCALGRPARYGRGEETLTDPAVRDTWEIPRELVSVDWAGKFDPVLEASRRALGLPPGCRLTAELHSMLVYERGQFFLPHQDSEKHDAMVATLVVQLPSAHNGGELVVHSPSGSPDGAAAVSYRGSRTETTLVVFYADRRHEVTPVKTGHRITLTYNLMLDGDSTDRGRGGGADPTVASLELLLAEHFRTRRVPRYRTSEDPAETDPPIRLAFLLDHEYTARSLSLARLKGVDAERAALLRAAAERVGCEVVLALADVQETWGAYDESDYYDRGRWRYHDDEEDDDDGDSGGYVLNDLIDAETRLTHWVNGTAVEEVSLALADDEVCSSTASVELTAREEQFEGYMGNYGNTLDRWYRRAALVIWPRELAFANRAEAAPSWALDDLLTRLRGGQVEQVRAEAVSMASFWAGSVSSAAAPDRLLAKALQVAHGVDDADAAALLLRPFAVESCRPSHAPALAKLAARYGDAWLGLLLDGWFGRPHGYAPGRREWVAALPQLCRRLGASPVTAERLVALSWAWLEGAIDRAALVGPPSAVRTNLADLGPSLAAVLHGAAAAGAVRIRDRVIDACLGRGDLAPCLIAALTGAASLPDDVRRDGRFADLAEHVASGLRARLAEPVRAADDWSITLAGGCGCALCTQLVAFLSDRSERTLAWPIKQESRAHVHRRIEAAELPVTHQTRRTGRPFTLVLTKTERLFTAERDRREQDRADLERLTVEWDLVPR